jgi:hypothetical protein
VIVAVIRPDEWNLPLLVHVAGAMLLVGALVLAAAALILARRSGGADDAAALTRLGYRALLLGVLPAWIVMRAGAQWIVIEEDREDSEEAWIGIGFITAEAGLLLIVIATVLAAIAARRARGAGGGGGLATGATALTLVLIAAYVIAVWAMTAKPS